MGSVEVVISLPLCEFLFQINVPFVRYNLVELFLVGPMRSLDLAVVLRGPGLDIAMPYAFVFNVPMELGLPFVTTIGPERLYSKRKLLDDVVGKVYCVLLRVPLIDLQRSNPSCVINGGILVTLGLFPFLVLEYQELNVHLDVMPGDAFGIAFRVDLTAAYVSGQASQLTCTGFHGHSVK